MLQHATVYYSRLGMSVRKRCWKTKAGEEREAWIVDYVDDNGRHIETFKRKKDADAREAKVKVDVGAGVHVAPSNSVTVKEAGAAWIKAAEARGLERATIKNYHEYLDRHIAPFIGNTKLSALNLQRVRAFEDALREGERSPSMVRRVLVSLGSILADAQERGLTAHNAVRERNRQKKKPNDDRQKSRLKAGVDIPTSEEIRGIIANAKGRWRPLLITAIFTGLRASELRGLTWTDIDLKKNELHVRKRADRFNQIGRPKSKAGERTVQFPKFVANTLKEWKLTCPKTELDLVFPSKNGGVEALRNIVHFGLVPAQPGGAKYTGMHSLRHFYASWCINRPKDGGIGLPPKNVQERLGHATISMTLDIYGHLFKSDDAEELDRAADALLG
jgi:integrase